MPDRADAPRLEGTVFGFDFGHRRIGVAVGQTATRTTSPVATLGHRTGPDWQALEKLVREWRPAGFVVGLPLDRDGGETDMSRDARLFGAALRARFGLPVAFFDERLTSSAARSDFAERRASGQSRRKHAGLLDAVAAAIILENWLQSLPA